MLCLFHASGFDWNYLVDGDQCKLLFCSEGPLGTAEMPTIMTSDIREDFQYSFISYFANTSSF